MTDFHIYPPAAAGFAGISIVLDTADPQRDEIMDALAAVFNAHGRSREADECLKIGKNC